MRHFFLSSLTMVAAMVVGSSAIGQDSHSLTDTSVTPVAFLGGGDGGCDVCDDKGCDDCGGCGVLDGIGCGVGSTYGLIEWTHFAYHRADGSRVGDTPGGDFAQADFHASMRYTAGYITAGGLGIRARYWRFGHSSQSVDEANGRNDIPGEGLYTNTYNFDLELFDTIQLNCNWCLEFSGGIRYNDFEELMIDEETNGLRLRFNASDSFGGVGGLEARRCLPIGSLYLGFRTSILMANDAVRVQVLPNNPQNIVLQDVPRQQFEIFGGWENEWCVGSGVAYLRVGAEWQHWMNFSSAFDGGNENRWDGESNVGFGGFVVGAGFIY